MNGADLRERNYRACPSVQEYVQMSTDEQVVDVYWRVTEKRWTVHLFEADEEVELKDINASIPIAILYGHVQFS